MDRRTETRVAVLEALAAERAIQQNRALELVKEDLGRRLLEMNHWRAEEIADKANFLRMAVYVKSEDARADWQRTVNDQLSQLRGALNFARVLIGVLIVPVILLVVQYFLRR